MDLSKKRPRLLRKLASFHLVSLEQVGKQPTSLSQFTWIFCEKIQGNLKVQIAPFVGSIMWQICKPYYPSADSEGYSFIMNSVDIFSVNGLRNRGAFNSMWQMWSWLFLLNDLVPKSSCYFLYWSFQPPHIPHVSHGDAGVCFFFSTYEHQVRICIAPLFKNARRERSGSRRIVSGMPGPPWDDWYMIMMDTERWENRKFKNMMQHWLLHNFFLKTTGTVGPSYWYSL